MLFFVENQSKSAKSELLCISGLFGLGVYNLSIEKRPHKLTNLASFDFSDGTATSCAAHAAIRVLAICFALLHFALLRRTLQRIYAHTSVSVRGAV
jgi:hypothetical protein